MHLFGLSAGEVLEGDLMPGRSPSEAPDVDPLVFVQGGCRPGEMVEATIVEAAGYDCIATLVREATDGVEG